MTRRVSIRAIDTTGAEDGDAPVYDAELGVLVFAPAGTGGGADDQTASEVSYSGASSGLSAGTVQEAIDEIVAEGVSSTSGDLVPLTTTEAGEPALLWTGTNELMMARVSE